MKVNQLEIYEKIRENNRLIQEAMQVNIFTLNNTVSELLEENRQLQIMCQHEFEDGACKYCLKMEDVSED